MYVYDFIFTAKDSMKCIRVMEYEYILKRMGVPEYYLAGNTKLGRDGKMSWSAKIYIKNVFE